MSVKDCLFCDLVSKEKHPLVETTHFLSVLDPNPVNKGHALIISRRHQPDIFSLNEEEWEDLQKIVESTKVYLDKEFMPAGYNIGVNIGEAAGQTIFHLHIHFIPRYSGDVKDPRGGIRNLKEPLASW